MKKANKKDSKVEELTNDVKRIQADFINFKGRIEKEKDAYAQYKLENFALEILEILDNFELSLANSKDRGIGMVYKQFLDVLARNGIEKIEENKVFDANLHEAIEKVKGKEGEIVDVLKQGYKINDKIIRPTQVRVGGGK